MAETIKQPQRTRAWVAWLRGCAIAAGVGFALLLGAGYLLDRAFPMEFEATANDYKDVENLRLVGYLPDTMPESVRDLKMRWNIDYENADATFFVAPKDIEHLVQGYELLESKSNDLDRFRRVRDATSGLFPAERVDMLVVNRATGKVEWSTRRNYL